MHVQDIVNLTRPQLLCWIRISLMIRRLHAQPGRQHSSVEIDYEIFSMAFFSILLIQEGQLSVCGRRMCTILVNHLED